MKIKHRSKASGRKNKKHFSKTARKVHKKNISGGPMRGGIRL
jgi:hypothetical protein